MVPLHWAHAWSKIADLMHHVPAGFEQLKLVTTLQHLNLAYTCVSSGAMLAWKTLVNLHTLILDCCTAVHDG